MIITINNNNNNDNNNNNNNNNNTNNDDNDNRGGPWPRQAGGPAASCGASASDARHHRVVHPVSVRRFPSFRTQPLENLTPLPMNKWVPEQPRPWRKSSERESHGDRVYVKQLLLTLYMSNSSQQLCVKQFLAKELLYLGVFRAPRMHHLSHTAN